MIGIDTNVLARYIVQDDPEQASVASHFIENNCSSEMPGFINHIVLCELIWVLKRCYKVKQSDALKVIEQILRTVQLQVQQPQVVWQAVKAARSGKADFADYLSCRINIASGCLKTVTFDVAASEIDNMELLK